VEQRGLEDLFDLDSAGTGAWHVGDPPDARMCRTALRHGVSLEGQRAQQFIPSDLETFDLVLAMDKENLSDILFFDGKGLHGHKVKLFRQYDPIPENYQVPDPYSGGMNRFEEVYQIVERTAVCLLDDLVEKLEEKQQDDAR